MPIVSVIIPVYKAENYLRQCVVDSDDCLYPDALEIFVGQTEHHYKYRKLCQK